MSNLNSFVPVTFDNIEDGAFRTSVEAAIAEASAKLAAHVEEWGERAGKAKAVIDISIEFKCENATPGEGFFSVVGHLKTKGPARPPKLTGAMVLMDGKRKEPCLFVRANGLEMGDPDQMHLPLEDSRNEEANSRSEAG